MNAFLSDLWHDLREKRLWPVAVLLAIGLVAVPVLLAKPAPTESASSAQPAATASKTKGDTLVALVDGTEDDSTLKLFDPRNPFKPKNVRSLEDLSSKEISAAAEALGTPDASSTGGGSTEGSSGNDIGGSGGGTTNPPEDGSGGGTTVAKYTYVIDVTFTDDGDTRHVNGMKRLEMLPSESSPLLLFLGVDSGGDDAVFLVDSTLEANGEGHCTPSDADCGLLTIGAGSVEEFTDDHGHSYKIRIDEIRKVKLSSSSSAARAKDSGEKPDKPKAGASAVSTRRFVPPILTDLVTVASQPGDGSSSDNGRR